jgi:hypothetical protein
LHQRPQKGRERTKGSAYKWLKLGEHVIYRLSGECSGIEGKVQLMKPLSDYSNKELDRLEENASRLLKIGKGKQLAEARELLGQIAEERRNRAPIRVENGEEIIWDNRNRNRRVGYRNEVIVAEIIRDEKHNSKNDEVYSVYIDGVRQDKRFRYVSNARKEVEQNLANRI